MSDETALELGYILSKASRSSDSKDLQHLALKFAGWKANICYSDFFNISPVPMPSLDFARGDPLCEDKSLFNSSNLGQQHLCRLTYTTL